jgi:hypothetical protein
MARTRARKLVARHYTPPIKLSQVDGQAKTPQQAIVIIAKAFAQELSILIPKSLVRKVTSVTERVQTRILASKQVRARHNIPNLGPDLRGPKRVITRLEIAVIVAYVDDESIPLNNRGAPWLDVAKASSV